MDDADLCEDDSEGGENGDEQFAVSHYESSFGLVDNSSTSPLNLSKDIIARIEGRKEGEENSSVDHLELRRGCEMRTLPGEADEEEERDVRSSSLSDDAIHKTELKMSTRRNQELEDTEETLKPKMNLEVHLGIIFIYIIGFAGKTASKSILTFFEFRYILKILKLVFYWHISKGNCFHWNIIHCLVDRKTNTLR